ncbi:universal stress protein [Pseudomonas sp. LD120]|uniref:universal stress protein n=1 Tax=Pseudomonas sp. LD120 TaxID=485751 RepID=UPI001356A00B|nr:universal stress protein [Pseudomonas sp. LD120]KAF0866542.1 universal stress protein [Pseudomonas sp. LD120]
MPTLQRVLLIAPTALSRTPAFDRASALARAMGASLHIVAFDFSEVLEVAGLFDHQAMAQAREGYLQVHRQWLEQQASVEQANGLRVTTEVLWAKAPLQDILDYVTDYHPDLVIKDAQPVPVLRRIFYRPLDWLLLRDLHPPLHLVTDSRHPLPLKVLAALDLSHLEYLNHGLNQRILEMGAALSRHCGALVHLLNVVDWATESASDLPIYSPDNNLSMRDAVNDAQQEAFETLAERYAIAPEHCHRLEGVPHQVITRFAADNDFDLMILGRVHRRGLQRFVGGSAEQLLYHAPCSLMLVEPQE